MKAAAVFGLPCPPVLRKDILISWAKANRQLLPVYYPDILCLSPNLGDKDTRAIKEQEQEDEDDGILILDLALALAQSIRRQPRHRQNI